MKIEMGKKYKARDKSPIKIYEIYQEQEQEQVHGAYLHQNLWHCCSWYTNGKYYSDHESNLDLIEVREDWELAIKLLKKREVVLVRHDVYGIIPVIEINEEDEKYVKIKHDVFFKRSLVEKESFKLATKKEALEYFFGGENEN